MKTLLVMVVNALLYVVIVTLSLGLLLVSMWYAFEIDNTPQNLWLAGGAFLAAMVLLSFLRRRTPGSWFSNVYRTPRPMGAFGVRSYLKREPGGAPEVPFGPHKFPDGDY